MIAPGVIDTHHGHIERCDQARRSSIATNTIVAPAMDVGPVDTMTRHPDRDSSAMRSVERRHAADGPRCMAHTVRPIGRPRNRAGSGLSRGRRRGIHRRLSGASSSGSSAQSRGGLQSRRNAAGMIRTANPGRQDEKMHAEAPSIVSPISAAPTRTAGREQQRDEAPKQLQRASRVPEPVAQADVPKDRYPAESAPKLSRSQTGRERDRQRHAQHESEDVPACS